MITYSRSAGQRLQTVVMSADDFPLCGSNRRAQMMPVIKLVVGQRLNMKINRARRTDAVPVAGLLGPFNGT